MTGPITAHRARYQSIKTTMAEGSGKNDGSDGGWWSSWMATAKEKTEKAFEMMSHDIAEFTSTMQSDTKKVVEKTKETLQQPGDNKGDTVTDKMATSFHNLMEGITKVLTVEPEDKVPTRTQIPQPATGIFDRAKARLRAIQTDTGTYLNDPTGPPEQYAEWLKSFNLDDHKGEVSDLLVSMVEVRSLYTTLVPSEVSHQDFWGKYFYKLHQMDKDEARKQALMQRAERANTKEDSISWDEEWSGDEESGSPAASKQKSKPPSDLKQSRPTQKDETKAEQSRGEELKSRLSPNISEDAEKKVPLTGEQSTETVNDKVSHTTETSQKEETLSTVKQKGPDKTEITNKQPDESSQPDPDKNLDPESYNKTSEDQEITETQHEVKDNVDLSCGCDEAAESDSNQAEEAEDKNKPEVCDKTEKDMVKDNAGLKTNVKGDMIVVGDNDRISPTSDSSGTKESSTDDWEKDFDVDISPEDLAAASQLAQKMNSSATDYTTLTGTEDDWESWE